MVKPGDAPAALEPAALEPALAPAAPPPAAVLPALPPAPPTLVAAGSVELQPATQDRMARMAGATHRIDRYFMAPTKAVKVPVTIASVAARSTPNGGVLCFIDTESATRRLGSEPSLYRRIFSHVEIEQALIAGLSRMA